MSAEDWRHLFNVFYKNGVFANPSTNFQVTTSASTGLYVTVNPGICFIEGAIGIEESPREMQLQAANASYDRIDTIVARLDLSTEVRSVDLYVLTGTAATTPVQPELTTTGNIYELGLANIYIPATATSISLSRITDTRLDTARCGIVTCNPEVIDTTTVFENYQDYLEHIETILVNAMDGTTAGHLQTQIDTLQTGKSAVTYYTANIGTTWVDQTGYYTQDVTVTGLLTTDKPVVDYVPTLDFNADVAADYGNIYKMMASANTLTIYSKEISTNVIPIQIMVVR
jgi:hypothetical protein